MGGEIVRSIIEITRSKATLRIFIFNFVLEIWLMLLICYIVLEKYNFFHVLSCVMSYFTFKTVSDISCRLLCGHFYRGILL